MVYEGFIEPQEKSSHHADYLYHFMLYYAGYIKVFVGGEEVVAERWRTAWNPNTYKFRKLLRARHRYALRIEWQPDGGTSYCGLRGLMVLRTGSASGARWLVTWIITS